MSSSPTWTIHEHIIPASHPRGYRRGVRDPQTSRLRLHIKQYVPSHHPASPTAITLIFQHGMPPGAAKEACEPFFWDLISHSRCPPVRAVWALDAAGFGQSFLLNKQELGDEPHWFDSVEDVRHMINHFQDALQPPLIGIGQSWGSVAMLMNASRHPRLFQAIILSDPVIENGWYHVNDPRRLSGELPPAPKREAGKSLALRRSRWPNRQEAERWLRAHKQYQQFSPRVLDQILKYELHDTDDGTCELLTPAAQVLPIFMRPSPPLDGFPEGEEYASRFLPVSDFVEGFYAGIGERVKQSMPGIHCKTLYMWASQDTFISDERYRERLVSITGTGLGGGGGNAKGQVDEMFVEGGHLLPLLEPTKTADAVVNWLAAIFWPLWLKEEAARVKEGPIDPVNLPGEVLKRLGVKKTQGDSSKTKL